MDEIYVIGHKNPDTDSICSALAYAELKQKMGINAVAIRLGPLNEETKFAIKHFDVEGPLLMKDARCRIKDIAMDYASTITKDTTAKEAWSLLFKARNKSLFVVDDSKLIGIVSTSNLASTRMMNNVQLERLMSTSTLNSIAKTVEGKVIFRSSDFHHNGKVYIVTLVEGVQYKPDFNKAITILSDGMEKQMQTLQEGCKCMIITCGEHADKEVIRLAREKDCAVIETDLDTMKVARSIYDAFPVSEIMSKQLVTFSDNEYVEDVSQKINKSRYRSYPVLNENGKLVGAISRYHIHNYEKKKFILVDHSERSQSIDNIMSAEIMEIIDHHHIGNIQTSYPIYYRNQKCGCTSTIVYQMYKENIIVPSHKMAAMMMSAIISDTLLFKSQTTTQQDIDAAHELADLVGIDLEKYAMEMLNASVALKDTDFSKIINRDLKNYAIGKYKVGISQTNYSNIEDIQLILKDFKEELISQQEDGGYDLLIMMFTHVMAEGTMFVYSGPLSYIMAEVVKTVTEEDTGFDPDLISRKQQVMPKISSILESI